MSDEQEIEVLKRQVKSLRQEVRKLDEWMDTVNSHWFKRMIWLFQGFRYHRLGRWYGH